MKKPVTGSIDEYVRCFRDDNESFLKCTEMLTCSLFFTVLPDVPEILLYGIWSRASVVGFGCFKYVIWHASLTCRETRRR
jgi:hypothetical protein